MLIINGHSADNLHHNTLIDITLVRYIVLKELDGSGHY